MRPRGREAASGCFDECHDCDDSTIVRVLYYVHGYVYEYDYGYVYGYVYGYRYEMYEK